jgi:nicotinate-nucleotide adenylyltransferase
MTRPHRIGILGGTFDPIHVGHLEAAAVAQRVLKLGELLLMPSMTPPHRHVQPYVSAFHRFAMVSLAIADRDGFIASDDELLASGPSYTSTTLGRLRERGFAPTELFFVLGSDAFSDISEWHRYPTVLDEAHFAVVARPGTAWADMRTRVPELVPRMVDAAAFANESDGRPRIVLLTASTPDVSSTEIRRRVAAGESLAGLTPPAVASHIERHGLYRNSSAGSEE